MASITGRKSQKEIRRRMNKVLCSLRRRASLLQDENNQLQCKHQLLAEMCDGFELFRQMQYQALHSEPALSEGEDLCSRAERSCNIIPCNLCTEEELQLLQQLQSLPPAKLPVRNSFASAQPTSTGGSSSSVSDISLEAPTAEERNTAAAAEASRSAQVAAAAAAVPQPIAPPSDSLRLLKQTLSQPPAIDAAQITLPQLIDIYSSTVRELSLYLVQKDAGMSCHAPGMCGQTPEQKIQQLMMEHWRLIALLCSERPELVTMLQLVNSDTGEVLPEPDGPRACWVLQQLHLSSQQQQRIAQGAALFKQLLAPVLEELRSLQQQQQQGPTSPAAAGAACNMGEGGCGSSSKHHSTAAVAAGSPSGDAHVAAAEDASCGMPQPFTHGRMLEQQQQRSKRMTTLLRKDHFMRTWFASYLFGCLSWTQIARMHVLLSPMYPTPYVFYTEVARQVAQQRGK